MFTATKRTLAAAAMIAAASGPSVAYARFDLDPSTRGVAIVSAPAVSIPRCPRVGPCIPLTLERQSEAALSESSPADSAPAPSGGAAAPYSGTTATRYPGLVPGPATTRYPGLVPGSTITRYPGLVPGSKLYPGLVPETGQPAAQSGESREVRASGSVTGLGGFDWGDGAIGALVVLGVMAAGFGAIVLVRRRRSNSLARAAS